MTKYFKSVLFSLFLSTIFLPMPCYADGVSPLINFFSKETYLSATVILTILIFFESFILWRSIKSVRYARHLLFSGIINILSSAGGSIIILAAGHDQFYFWNTMNLIFPLFLITLIIEFPAIKFLYKDAVTWKQSLWIDLKINILSYLLVFAVQFLLIIGLMYLN